MCSVYAVFSDSLDASSNGLRCHFLGRVSTRSMPPTSSASSSWLSTILVAVATQGAAGSEDRLVAVEVMPGNSASKVSAALCVELSNGRRIGVGSGFDAATLERLLMVLEQG